MKELVEKVLETEKRAAALVSEAREKAAAIQSEADRDASGIIEKAKVKASGIVESAVRKAEEDVAALRAERISETEKELDRFREEMRLRLDTITARAVELVIRGEEER